MPNKQHHDVLVFKKTVWLSVDFDTERDTQRWRVYKHCRGTGKWWLGLVPKGYIPGELINGVIPKPVIKAYAFTEYNGPQGTDLWVEYDPPNEFQIWYSPLLWKEVLDTGKSDWEYVGIGLWESA